MKFLQLGFVAIIALCVMSFTVADHAGVFKKLTAHKKAYTCKSGDFSKVTDESGTVSDATTGIACAAFSSCYTFANAATFACDDVQTKICCFTQGSNCAAPHSDKQSVSAVHCNSITP